MGKRSAIKKPDRYGLYATPPGFSVVSNELHHRLRRGQIECRSVVLEVPLVRAVAEGLLGAQAAAADADALAAAKAVGLAFCVHKFKIFALHAERAIGENSKFGRHGEWLVWEVKVSRLQVFAQHEVVHPVRADGNVLLAVLREALPLVERQRGVVAVHVEFEGAATDFAHGGFHGLH